MLLSGHWKGKLAKVCRCRIFWKRPENQRWNRKLLIEMNGEPRNTFTAARGEATDQRQGAHCPGTFDQVWRSEKKLDVLRACWIISAEFESTNTGYRGQ